MAESGYVWVVFRRVGLAPAYVAYVCRTEKAANREIEKMGQIARDNPDEDGTAPQGATYWSERHELIS